MLNDHASMLIKSRFLETKLRDDREHIVKLYTGQEKQKN